MSKWQEYDWDMMIRRRAPVPLIAVALLLSLWLATAESGSITAVKCKADHAELLASIEAARQQTIDQINLQLADTGDYQRIETLLAMRERAWDEEEAQRGSAQHIFYDCISAAKRPG
ncbi:MAG TPA: hypothetical protein DIW51_15155 [Rhodospirillaceae bacterium]|nr:hypothetical protein [Magnetovibrio sp.]HBT41233.1 hypothetical protein [Rhodospirillaceae bacterium]HCS71299.1 hypothetical protein [Rhodospirillaceae bacterium]|tara:strand:- start:1451 stop:1801 length:351 start_codon:yes stop_codon:yes gene_type:complete